MRLPGDVRGLVVPGAAAAAGLAGIAGLRLAGRGRLRRARAAAGRGVADVPDGLTVASAIGHGHRSDCERPRSKRCCCCQSKLSSSRFVMPPLMPLELLLEMLLEED